MLKYLLALTIAGAGLISTPVLAFPQTLEATEAASHVGETVTICGQIDEVTHLQQRTVLNISGIYPFERLSFLIWDKDVSDFNLRFGRLEKLKGLYGCGYGTLVKDRDHLFMELTKVDYLQIL